MPKLCRIDRLSPFRRLIFRRSQQLLNPLIQHRVFGTPARLGGPCFWHTFVIHQQARPVSPLLRPWRRRFAVKRDDLHFLFQFRNQLFQPRGVERFTHDLVYLQVFIRPDVFRGKIAREDDDFARKITLPEFAH